MNYFLSVIRNFSFEGRARRAEFWWFVLFSIIIGIALNFVSTMVGLTIPIMTDPYTGAAVGYPILGLVYSLATLIQSLALSVRRLHDRNMSGWWILIAFIPLIGGLVLLVFYILPGTQGDNKFGPDPKAGG